jgi:cytochrome c553
MLVWLVFITVAGVAVAAAAEPGLRPAATEPPVYRSVISDLMNTVIQPRHIKLWLAGKAQNWPYAEYERHNIGGALARIATAIPTYKDQPTADLIAAFATPQLADLERAIKAKDEAAFATAYEALTTGCNQCHTATDHAMVVMQTPGSNPFPDQVFAPQAR